MSAGLSLEEFGHLVGLLQRFAENDLDQFDSWQVATSYGPVYIQLDRELPGGAHAEAFRLLQPPSPCPTGRAAQVSGPGEVISRSDVVRLVGEMLADYRDAGAREWENGTLERFLEAFGGYLSHIDGYYANQGEKTPAQPDWHMLALLLVAASGYE